MPGPGGSPAGMGYGAGACALGSGALSDDVVASVDRALADERRAESQYAALAQHLESTPNPFRHIVRSEVRHSFELERLLSAHGAAIPAPSSVPAPSASTLPAACTFGVGSEQANIALYDRLLEGTLPGDVRCVFERLRAASLERHLPAFQGCASPP